MKFTLPLAALLLLPIGCSPTSPAAAQSKPADPPPVTDPSLLDPTVLAKVKDATVLIGNFENGQLTATGSGFVVGDGKKVVTNKHVVTGTDNSPDSLKLVFWSGTDKARIVTVPAAAVSSYGSLPLEDPNYHKEDLAQIRLTDIVSEPIKVDEDVAIQETMPVWALGFPKGTNIMSDQEMPSVTVHSLRVERIERSKEVVNLLQLSGSPTNGNSGGPVVNREGKVIGVIEAKTVDAPILFAIPSVRVNKMLAGNGPGTTSASIAQLFKAPIGGTTPSVPDPAPAAHRSDGGPIQTSGSYLNQMTLSESDLEGWTAVQLTVLRNEPFARRGYIFRRADLRRIFARFDWYHPRTTNLNAVQRLLTKRESRNVDFIKSYQSSHGLGY